MNGNIKTSTRKMIPEEFKGLTFLEVLQRQKRATQNK